MVGGEWLDNLFSSGCVTAFTNLTTVQLPVVNSNALLR